MADTSTASEDAATVAAKRDRALRAALTRYRIMAFIVGVGLLLLVVVGMPLQYGAGEPIVVQIVGPFHGFLYIVYLLTVIDLWQRARCSFWQLVAMVAAGFVPFLAFYVEHRTYVRLSVQLDGPTVAPV